MQCIAGKSYGINKEPRGPTQVCFSFLTPAVFVAIVLLSTVCCYRCRVAVPENEHEQPPFTLWHWLAAEIQWDACMHNLQICSSSKCNAAHLQTRNVIFADAGHINIVYIVTPLSPSLLCLHCLLDCCTALWHNQTRYMAMIMYCTAPQLPSQCHTFARPSS